MAPTKSLALTIAAAALTWAIAPSPNAQAADQATQATYSAPLRTAIDELPVATENRSGYDRAAFKHWTDANSDGCDTRDDVLLEEADDKPTVGSGCRISGGRWFSYYDRVSVEGPSGIDIDHMVPLAEAWSSGARDWDSGRREAYANDLGDRRSLVGVSAASNRSKSDQDPASWLPQYYQCRYIAEWTAVKIRWDLTIDSDERTALQQRSQSCDNVTVTVERV